jgi:protein-S-isoprenylcysteine O-methyltransferase Ste14
VLRLTLLLGLVLHKVLWEVMKRAEGAPAQRGVRPPAGKLAPVKLAKMGALGFLVVQTLALNVLPISARPRLLRKVGLLLYLSGLTVAIAGRLGLGNNWVDLEDSQVLPEHAVVSTGIYGYIRHPIYTGDLLLLAGLQLALNSWLVLGVLAPVLVVFRRAAVEERQLVGELPEYASYQARTKRFIPFVV